MGVEDYYIFAKEIFREISLSTFTHCLALEGTQTRKIRTNIYLAPIPEQ